MKFCIQFLGLLSLLAGSQCLTENITCSEPGLKIRHPSICESYLECMDEEYQAKACEDGEYFNGSNCVLGKCDEETQYEVSKFECPKKRGNFPHPKFCHVFFKCNNYKHRLEFCRRGQLFNETYHKCTSKAECGNKTKPDFICPYKKGKFPHPNNCNLFYQCTNYKHVQNECPSDMVFNSDSKHCVKSFPCVSNDTTVFTCPSTSGGKYRHPTRCNLYYKCQHGIPQLRACPKGKAMKYESCVKDKKCKDEDITTTTNDYSNSTSPTTALPLSVENNTDFECPTYKVLIPHPQFCKKYFECRKGQKKEKHCGKGKKFNSDAQKCTESSRCVDNDSPGFKCPDKTGLFPHSQCNLFYKCNHHVPQLVKCHKGKSFDADRKKCIRDKDCVADE